MTPPSFRPSLKLADRTLDLRRPALMGVINANPDSFSDPGHRSLAAIVDHAHFQRIASVAEVGAVLARIGLDGRRGLDPLIDVLDERSDGAAETQSYLERLLGEVLALAGIREFSRQHPLPTDGSFHGWVDVYLAWARLIIEADGRRWHSRQADMRRDRERDLAAAERGVQTVRFLHEQLRDRPEECAERLARVSGRDVRIAIIAATRRQLAWLEREVRQSVAGMPGVDVVPLGAAGGGAEVAAEALRRINPSFVVAAHGGQLLPAEPTPGTLADVLASPLLIVR